jgi:Tol biopolymer transport system component
MNTKFRTPFGLMITILFCISLSITSSSAQNPPQALVGITERVSVSSDGMQGNGNVGHSTISADGRYVAFDSSASNLVVGDTNDVVDVFIHDRVTGETTRVSVASDGTQANYDTFVSSISADGRYVAFQSIATNLVAGDTNLCNFHEHQYNCNDVFLHDRLTGETTLVSVASDGTHGNWNSTNSSISGDGRYVAFNSPSSNLVVGDTNICFPSGIDFGCPDIFVHDRLTGETTRVSVASDGTQGDSYSEFPSISEDGRFVSFVSAAANLVPGDTNGFDDILVHDRVTGETTRVSVATDGSQGNNWSINPSISADGRFVAFASTATNLVIGDTNNGYDIFVHDRVTGETIRVSVASDGTQGDSYSWSPSISDDGRFVSFASAAANLVAGDTNGVDDIFVHDRVTGETTRISISSDRAQANDRSEYLYTSNSADGRYVTFTSMASNLVVGDTNNYCDNNYDGIYTENCWDVFVRDREAEVVPYSVSGHITDIDGNPISGVSISAEYGYSAITDIQGDYTISGLPSGTFKIIPSLVDIFFAPCWRTVTVPPERVGINFTEGFPAFLPMINR